MTRNADPGPLPRAQNYTYNGHTSDIIPTPWPYEGRQALKGVIRRFPPKAQRTEEQEAERIRLAAIENPGRCQARRRNTDAWCHNRPERGLLVCRWHGGSSPWGIKKKMRVRAEMEAQKKAAKIIAKNDK